MQKVEVLIGRLNGQIMIASCVKPSYDPAHTAQRDFTQGVKEHPGCQCFIATSCAVILLHRVTLHVTPYTLSQEQ